jgi:hypothetical protein
MYERSRRSWTFVTKDRLTCHAGLVHFSKKIGWPNHGSIEVNLLTDQQKPLQVTEGGAP